MMSLLNQSPGGGENPKSITPNSGTAGATIPLISGSFAALQESWTKQELLEVAKFQRSVLRMFLISLGALFVVAPILISLGGMSVVSVTLAILGILVSGFFQAYFNYKLSHAVRDSAPWLYFVMGLIPLAGNGMSRSISERATLALQKNGIKVGLMGARMSDFDKVM